MLADQERRKFISSQTAFTPPPLFCLSKAPELCRQSDQKLAYDMIHRHERRKLVIFEKAEEETRFLLSIRYSRDRPAYQAQRKMSEEKTSSKKVHRMTDSQNSDDLP